ncbi:transposase [Streptomyces scopuliridis]
MLTLVRERCAATGAELRLVSHALAAVRRHADRVAVMYAGSPRSARRSWGVQVAPYMRGLLVSLSEAVRGAAGRRQRVLHRRRPGGRRAGRSLGLRQVEEGQAVPRLLRPHSGSVRLAGVRMYLTAEPKPVVRRMAEDLGVHHEALRDWIRQAEADAGERDDLLTTAEREELAALRKENAQLKRANEVLRTASAFFAAQLDPTRPR